MRIRRRSQQALGVLGVLLTATLWAGSGIFITLILDTSDLSPFNLAFYRDLLTFSCLFFGLAVFRRDLLRVSKQSLPWLAGMGGLGLGAFHLAWNFGVAINGVAVSTVQQAIMPIIVAVAALVLFKEPLTKNKLVAVALTFAGAFFLSGIFSITGQEINTGGIAVGFAIPITFACFNLFSKQVAGKYHPLTIVTYGFGFGALALLPIQFFIAQPGTLSFQLILLLAGFVLFSTILPFLLYTYVLRTLEVSFAGTLAMAEIPIAFLFAYILFGEMFTVFQWLGTGLILLGIALYIRHTRQ